jgi:hypothetical protein
MGQKELKALVGSRFTNYAFTSSGTHEGAGFSYKEIIWNIYAPAGTRMMYMEPFSAYGNGAGLHWDGVSRQQTFGPEAEMLIQRGTHYKITKAERGKDGRIYIDVEARCEMGYELIQQDPSEWKGSRDTYKT